MARSPITHRWNIKSYLEPFLKNGTKSLEVRVNDKKRKSAKVGDQVDFNKSTKKSNPNLIKTIKAIRKYPNFADMLLREPSEAILPGKSRQELLILQRKFYPSEKERLGVLVFELESMQ